MSCGWLCFAAHGLLDLCSNMVLRAESISIQRWNNKVMPWTLMLWGTLREVARSSGRAHKCIDTSGSIHKEEPSGHRGKKKPLSFLLLCGWLPEPRRLPELWWPLACLWAPTVCIQHYSWPGPWASAAGDLKYYGKQSLGVLVSSTVCKQWPTLVLGHTQQMVFMNQHLSTFVQVNPHKVTHDTRFKDYWTHLYWQLGTLGKNDKIPFLHGQEALNTYPKLCSTHSPK